MSLRRARAARAKGDGARPRAPMSTSPPESEDVVNSVRRVRRGCLGIAILFAAFAVFLTTATGNLFYLTLLLITVAMLVLRRFVQ
jgi:hypothetical protein